jgi:hypothetical protein
MRKVTNNSNIVAIIGLAFFFASCGLLPPTQTPEGGFPEVNNEKENSNKNTHILDDLEDEEELNEKQKSEDELVKSIVEQRKDII